MTQPAVAAKPCTVCGVDCAQLPRVKDKQGRYMCQTCFEKVKQTKQVQKAPPPAPAPVAAAVVPLPNDNSFLLDINKDAAASSAKACPECGRALTGNAVLCIGCGYNLKTGKRLSVKVERAKKVRESSGGGGIDIGFGGSALLFLVLYGIGFACMFASSDTALLGGGLIALLAIGVSIWAIVLGFMESVGWGFGAMLPILSLYFVFGVNEDERLKGAYAITILANIAWRVMEATNTIQTF